MLVLMALFKMAWMVCVSLVMRGTDGRRLDACRDELVSILGALGGEAEEFVQ